MDDLFGNVPQPDLFSDAVHTTAPVRHTPETIRAGMIGILAEAKAGETEPWTPRPVRSHTAMFPYMAEWLKGGEGEQLLHDLKAEMG